MNHKYILEKYKGMNTRHKCPHCQQRVKTFTLYIDTETGEHLNNTVGKCARESKCGYHYGPKQYFKDNNISFDKPQGAPFRPKPIVSKPSKPILFIPVHLFKNSLKGYERNNFVKFLISKFGPHVTGELIAKYFIGTSKHWPGSSIFWQIDVRGKVRTGKIMLYNPITGKRVKEPYNHITWAHKAIQVSEMDLKQCFYGAHLLADKTKPIALVEGEKSAIIASVYFPQFIWLAVGSLTNLTADKCNILEGRAVSLFPDLNGFDKWTIKAKELAHITNFFVSDLLERKATKEEREQGLDIVDYLLRFDHKRFTAPESIVPKETTITQQGAVTSKEAEIKKPVHCSTMTLEEFNVLALSHYDKYFIRTFGKGLKINYFSMWADGMQSLFDDAGITKKQFLNSIKYN